MSFSLTWMPDVLLKADLKVALTDAWQMRGHGDVGSIRGILCHHTAGPRNGNMPSLNTLLRGRPGLDGPLAQLGLGRDGTFYVVAAGLAYHAGAGSWQGITTGNTNLIGIEAENTGLANDPWPDVQLDAYRRGAAALLRYLGLPATACAGHKEFALPKGRKIDPSFDMSAFRVGVAAILDGTAPAPRLIPAKEPDVVGKTARATLRRGATGPLVSTLQKLLREVKIDGNFGGLTEARVRAIQRELQLVPDGIVGPRTWQGLDTRTPPGA